MKASDYFVRKHMPIQGLTFVLMPFSEPLNNVYDHAIKPVIEDLDMQCKRADEIYSASSILGDIWDSIQKAEIIIADLTQKNPNVMYELGLCHALWKKVILVSQNRDDVPFDLKQWRVIWYDFTFAGAARLKDELQRAIIDLRKEQIIEAKITPLDGELPESQDEDHASNASWLVGKIDSWREDRGFGFILANSETFYCAKDAFFLEHSNIVIGSSVVFHPHEKIGDGKYRRADFVFIEGQHVSGKIQKCIHERGFSFARIKGKNDHFYDMFLLTGKGVSFEIGQMIDCAVGCNIKGPVGRNVRSITEDGE